MCIQRHQEHPLDHEIESNHNRNSMMLIDQETNLLTVLIEKVRLKLTIHFQMTKRKLNQKLQVPLITKLHMIEVRVDQQQLQEVDLVLYYQSMLRIVFSLNLNFLNVIFQLNHCLKLAI
jgi:hypothetical protein